MIVDNIYISYTIGHSVENRDLLLVQLGKGEKKIVLVGSHHAREYINTTLFDEDN